MPSCGDPATSAVDGHVLALAEDLRSPDGMADHLRYEWRFTLSGEAGRPSKRGFWPVLLRALENQEGEFDSQHLELFEDAIGPEVERSSPHIDPVAGSSALRLDARHRGDDYLKGAQGECALGARVLTDWKVPAGSLATVGHLIVATSGA